MTSQLVPTPSNMVSTIRNAIESYHMGPLRALAQEPVQNALDEKRASIVRVEYRLHRRSHTDGTQYYLLTITDSGTGGLKGPVLSPEDLDAIGYRLEDGQNWAAFEGQGFTEKNEGDLGSRGQGKSAALYHSNPSMILNDDRERKLILYDTLLENGEYRFGMRFAQPADKIMSPPLYEDYARITVMNEHTVEIGLTVMLDLDELTEVGTRIIIPFVTQDAIDAIHNEELHRWLQRCWWRSIQAKNLEITVADEDGNTQTIQPPFWWLDEPWTGHNPNVAVYSDLEIADGLKIKRVVVSYDPQMQYDEIPRHSPQYAGIQLLRGQQWIETINFNECSSVPADRRPGLRAFAEFDQPLERELKYAEKPQHESFDGRHQYVSETKSQIRAAVDQFAKDQGWAQDTKTERASRHDHDHAADFLTTFINPPKKQTSQSQDQLDIDNPPSYQWECSLSIQFPDQNANRVDWGQLISDVTTNITVEPVPAHRRANLSLEITSQDTHSTTVIQAREIELSGSVHTENFGNFQVIRGIAHDGRISCPEEGIYTLNAYLTHAGQTVASASKRLYVQTDPPGPPERNPFTFSVAVQNLSEPGSIRINSGDEVLIHIAAKNRTIQPATITLTASLEDHLLCDAKQISLPATPAGDTPQPVTGIEEHLRLYTELPPNPPGAAIHLEPGRHIIRADITVQGHDQEALHASRTIFFEVNPAGQNPDLPFHLQAIEEEGPHPMWDLVHAPPDQWTLQYHAHHPIHRELQDQTTSSGKTGGRLAFITEICASALLEWAIRPLQVANASNIDVLKRGATNGASNPVRDQYLENLNRLEQDYEAKRKEEPSQYELLKRQTVADMLHIFQRNE